MVECQSPKDSKIVFDDDDLVMDSATDGWGNSTMNSGATNLAWNSQSHEANLEVWGSKSSNPGTSSGWNSAPVNSQVGTGWSSQSVIEEPKKNKAENTGSWGGSQSWTSANEEFTPLEIVHEGSSGWNSRTLTRCHTSKTDHGNMRETRSPWKQSSGSPWKKKIQNYGRGSSDARDWRNKPNRPPRSLAPRRMDLYTPEENNIRSEIDPIMKSVRRIMQQEGYTDGVPIPREDQAYIVNNVLAYHPDRDAKARGGIDHIMVSKHSSFQGTRCFYVVSSNGQKQDFSYKKCLENRVKSKYPFHAESFISKYWRRNPRSGVRQVLPELGQARVDDPAGLASVIISFVFNH
ncbi:hypothetical protein V2J09_022527 [Rumex salicifolius]